MTSWKTVPGLGSSIVYEMAVRNYGLNGTLNEVTDDLERVRKLGVDVIYLQPIQPLGVLNGKGRDGSLYAIADYRAVRPELGTEADLRRLFERAHALGMRVVLDVVYNHAACDSVLLRDHPEFFVRDAAGRPSRAFEDWSDIYDLDFGQPGLRAWLIETLHHWADMGADGFRCDVAPMVSLDFWVEARGSFGDREMVWIAETFPPSYLRFLRKAGHVAHSNAEMYAAFDLTYDYDGYECLQSYWRGTIELGEYLRYVQDQALMNPVGALKLRFLENHDIPRIASVITSPGGLRNWTLLNLTLPGATMLEAGQEAGITFQASLFDREPIPWASRDAEFERFFHKAVALAKKIKAACSDYEAVEIASGLVRVTWAGEDERYVAILNLEDRFGEIDLPESIKGQELLTGKPIELAGRYQISKDPLLVRLTD